MANVAVDMEKGESLCTAGMNVHWCSHYGKQYVHACVLSHFNHV